MEPLPATWEKCAARDIAGALHELTCGNFNSPEELARYLEELAATLRRDHGGVLSRHDPISYMNTYIMEDYN